MATHKIKVDLIYERYSDRYTVTCDNIPGFHMSGPDLDVIQADLNEVVSDLLRLNQNISVDTFDWIPSLEEIRNHLAEPSGKKPSVFVVHGQLAA